MPQLPLDYQARSSAAAGRRRWKRAAVWWGLGVFLAPVSLMVLFMLRYADPGALAPKLLFPLGTLALPLGTDARDAALLGQFSLYALVVGAAELTGDGGRRRALIGVSLVHLLAAGSFLAAWYAAGG